MSQSTDVQLQGVGSTARIITADLMCGASVIHVIDRVLLPFSTLQGNTTTTTASDVTANAG